MLLKVYFHPYKPILITEKIQDSNPLLNYTSIYLLFDTQITLLEKKKKNSDTQL